MKLEGCETCPVIIDPGCYTVQDLKTATSPMQEYLDFTFVPDSRSLFTGSLEVRNKTTNQQVFYCSPILSVLLGILNFQDYQVKMKNIKVTLPASERKQFRYNILFGVSELSLHCNLFLQSLDFHLTSKSLTKAEMDQILGEDNLKTFNILTPRTDIQRINIRTATIYFKNIFGGPVYFKSARLLCNVQSWKCKVINHCQL